MSDDLDSLGFAASKLWNVGRWVCDRVWSEIGHIPGHNELTTYLKSHERYDDLFVCKVEIEVSEAPGEKTVGVDLGINNFAALAYEDGHSELYPLNCLKQDDYYFSKRLAQCDDSDPEQPTRLNQKNSARRTHYFHTLSKHIVQRCVDEDVGTIVVGDLSGIREDEKTDESKNWGKHGNLDLHSWAFDRFTSMLAYKAEIDGITVKQVSERDTSKSCSCCGRKRKANRVERGLYVCDECETVANADVNGAENIRQKVSPNPHGEDRSNGWLAQPSTFLFDKETGVFAPQEHVTS
ncbi:transposase, IS605 OrfB family, central region [Halobaculum gomorrense]|uniref:Transposase, IS605 OrfB family, central region n=1 Tax=Halobaculum gomorrense TaxID=43928 RepID=A0A1M5SKG5_9EURY|nr:transposase, IS605 OrfB family, central region [Halobaculum gomorrense]